MSTPSEIAFQMDDVGSRMLLSPGGLPVEDIIAAGSPVAPDVNVDEDAPYWARFTSGTTGKPRAYTVTNRCLTLLTQQLASELNYRSDDVLLINAPLAHAAFAFAVAAVAAGATIVLAPSFDADTIWQECDKHGVTQLFMVPTMLAMSVSSAGSGASIRRLSISASTLAPSLRARTVTRFPHIDLTVLYGASELGLVTVLHGRESAGKERSVGRPRFGYSLKVLDDEGHPVSTGEVGTIYVQGPSLCDGYIGSVPAPADAVREGWVTPGDMGELDADGFLYLADRRSDLIISGGLNVYPAEVENTLLEVDGVREVAVIGVPDDVWGNKVTAVLVGDVSAAALDAHCRHSLAGYKIPRRYEFVTELPHSAVGKVLRRKVREMFSES